MLRIDPFLVKLLVVVLLASLLPARGGAADLLGWLTTFAIALLFFMHGARLSREAIVSGMTHWRLHVVIFSMTFLLFPLLGVLGAPLTSAYLTPELQSGLLFLCCLPATVQSAIAFTSMARGNVPAAVCSASASSLLGVFVTPALAGLLLLDSGSQGDGFHYDTIGKIMLQLLLPFVAGHLSRPWTGAWMARRNASLKLLDQGTILLVVYTAFSAAVIDGLWARTPIEALVAVVIISMVLLALVMGIGMGLGRLMGFSLEDRITLLFCGSKKSLATGIPMANILFASHAVGSIVLPLMVFHQIQLIVCAVIAGAYARRPQLRP
ncbi:bile acid:sodium symporter [Pusillimonas caeni]|uniref:bile acid:sodium symporter family protein n=1 Tax=Pusillimonas caeni TaxID=1348472 RepID=UPI000E59F0B5|nr:bile acid:sodium symporter family protein [Pusillimonas caeni]TFL09325.1 bile acid:sodium symporter [Pusillimonas caeni]